MHFKIKQSGANYEAIIYNESSTEVFRTINSLEENILVNALIKLGFHQTDVLDAMNKINRKSLNIPHPLINPRANDK